MTDLSTAASLLAALASAAILAVLHLLAPRIRRLPFVPERATGSFAGGLAVAYVFLHLLPELSEGNRAVGEALQEVVTVTPLLDLGIFLVALAGFVLFYGLERLARRTVPGRRRPMLMAPSGSDGGAHRHGSATPVVPSGADAAGMAGAEAGPPLAFRLHLASFFVYNFLITYTMPLRFRTGVLFAVLFTVAMGLHFLLTDRGLEEHYPARFGASARLLLAAALGAGWLVAALLAPTNALVVSLLTAFLGGSILLNVFKEELPSNRQSSFGWFTVGLTGYAVLLAVVTYVAE